MYSQTKIAIPIFQAKKEDVIKVAEDCIEKGADVLERFPCFSLLTSNAGDFTICECHVASPWEVQRWRYCRAVE